ncbi:hypothetical protein ABVV53_13595 [Novosphingobium sp. RD2P27]|uniref:Uncharacterized protein n=1 Tax=Novosphingobium kalidii TaxID=3230299 RepID=A0ABV2D3M3_9SPHN
MEDILKRYRERIEAMEFEPLSDDEASARRAADAEGVASVRLEGLELTAFDAAFLDMLAEFRVPQELSSALTLEFTRDMLATNTHARHDA